MSGLTLSNIFGTNATQDIDQIIIQKSDLKNSTGFEPQDENDGEAIFVALLVQAKISGLDTDHRDGIGAFEANIDQQVAISDPVQSFVDRIDSIGAELACERQSFTIDLDKEAKGIDPNDY